MGLSIQTVCVFTQYFEPEKQHAESKQAHTECAL